MGCRAPVYYLMNSTLCDSFIASLLPLYPAAASVAFLVLRALPLLSPYLIAADGHSLLVTVCCCR